MFIVKEEASVELDIEIGTCVHLEDASTRPLFKVYFKEVRLDEYTGEKASVYEELEMIPRVIMYRVTAL